MIWGFARASAHPTRLGSCSIPECPVGANPCRPWEHHLPAQVLALLCQLQGQGWQNRTKQSPPCSPPALKKKKKKSHDMCDCWIIFTFSLFCYYRGRIQIPALKQSELQMNTGSLCTRVDQARPTTSTFGLKTSEPEPVIHC